VAFEIGEKVGLYKVVEQLGQGGMATVFKAYHTVLERHVALKVLHPAFLEEADFLRRFRREARVVAGLDHANIVPLFDFAEHRGLPYLVMKYIEGETLKARLARGMISRQLGCQIMESVGRALAYAHKRGVLHRDVKPSNILLARDGSIYLSDFGLARIVAAGESTISTEMMMGTPQYVSPEQARTAPDLDERTDIYSLGVVLYELVTGRVPFEADTPISVINDHLYTPPPPPSSRAMNVSPAIEHVILRALAKRLEDRFKTVEEMVFAFREADEEGGMGVMLEATAEPDQVPLASQDAGILALGGAYRPEAVSLELPSSHGAALVSSNGIRFPLAGERLLVGRGDLKQRISPDIDLTEAEPPNPKTGRPRRTVHRQQAWLLRTEQGWSVEVLPGKEDRAWLNGARMTAGRRYPLRAGDRLKLGAVELEAQF